MKALAAPQARLKLGARVILAAAMIVAGIAHFINPLPFLQHIPPWIPQRELIVYATGVIEVVLGLGLLAAPSHRRAIGRVLAVFLLAVFPGNIYVAVADVEVDGLPGGAYPWVRLPFQFVLIAWALWCTDDGPARLSGAPVPVTGESQ